MVIVLSVQALIINSMIFFRSPPFGKLRTGFDKLRANGKILNSSALLSA
jgi:hypothetical protein